MEVKILKQEIIGPGYLKEILEDSEKKLRKASKKGEELSLNSIQQKTKDSIAKFNKLNKDDELKLLRELTDLKIVRLTDNHLAQIITIIPKDIDELKTIFAGSKTTITPEDLEKIQSTIKQYEK